MAVPAPKATHVRFEPCMWCGANVGGYTASAGVERWGDRISTTWPGGREVTLIPCGHTVRSIRFYTREP